MDTKHLDTSSDAWRTERMPFNILVVLYTIDNKEKKRTNITDADLNMNLVERERERELP